MNNKKEIFEELNNNLKNKNKHLTLICVGGYVLEYYNIRATIDIDAFYEETKEIKEIINKIGEKYNINPKDELWINNSVQNMNEKPELKLCKKIYSNTNLEIYIPSLEYIIGMKLKSGRENDIKDIANIIKYLKIENIKTLTERLKKLKFENYDESLLLEGFGEAYGLNWLKKYFTQNEKNIIEKIDKNPSESKITNNKKDIKNEHETKTKKISKKKSQQLER